MTLEVLQKEMIAAMKNKNKIRKDAISSLIGNIKKAAIDEKCQNNITEELVNKIILKEKKTVQEMINTCPVERTDVLDGYRARIIVIDEFAPKMMSEDEIRIAVYNIIAAADIQKTNKGAIMKVVMPELKGKADGKLINKIVTEIATKAGE